jgi:hypothetical protein
MDVVCACGVGKKSVKKELWPPVTIIRVTGKNRVTVWPFFRINFQGFQRKTPDIQTKN